MPQRVSGRNRKIPVLFVGLRTDTVSLQSHISLAILTIVVLEEFYKFKSLKAIAMMNFR